MKRMLVWVVLLLMFCASACALELPENAMHHQVREKLAQMGYPVSEQAYEDARRQLSNYQQMAQEYAGMAGMESFYAETLTGEYFAYILLMNEGLGTYDEETWAWSPSSEHIYAFDAEFLNIDVMYTEFLLGVQAIVPDIRFADVAEDLSGMSDEWDMETYSDGTRSVSFTCNGHPYSITLDSYGDWLNDEIISFVNHVLETEGSSGQLHIVSEPYDQCVFLIYGSSQEAAALRQVLGVETVVEMPVMEDLPPLMQKVLDFLFLYDSRLRC